LVLFILTTYQEAHADTEKLEVDNEVTEEFPIGVTKGEGFLVIVGDEAIRQREAEIVENKLNDDNPSDDAYYTMIRDLGGLSEYYDFLDHADPDEISALNTAYGTEVYDISKLNAPSADNSRQYRSDSEELDWELPCPEVYSPQIRNKNLDYNKGRSIFFNIDSHGRPALASTSTLTAPPGGQREISPTERCTKTIRQMGETDDEAGHLIPKTMLGPPIRANLVPQNSNMNGGIWGQNIEKTMFKCAKSPFIKGYYTVEPIYNGSNLRPVQLKVTMRAKHWIFATRFVPAKYAEYFFYNAHSSWHGGHNQKMAKKWDETFKSHCQ